MPWQRLVADVAGERLPDGAYAYQTVVVTVPRQAGKTTLMRARLVARCLARPGARVMYTAQTGKDARERWEDLCAQVMASPLRSRVHIRKQTGSSRLEFWNGSQLRVFTPIETAIHGATPLEVHIDEAWAFDRIRGNALLAAITPAQITVHDRQLWIVSTAGTAASTFLRDAIDAALDGAPRVALFDWSCPDGADPYDPDVVRGFHPAAGLTQDPAAIIASGATLPRADYERAYANRWTRTVEAVIPADTWAALAAPAQTPPPAAGLYLAGDVAHDRRSAAIVAGWLDDDARLQLKVVRADAGYSWLAPELVQLAARLDPALVVLDGAGPVRSITDALTGSELDRRGRLRILTPAEYATGCGEFLAAVHTDRVRHDASTVLADAAASAVTRPLGDVWIWSRSRSRGPIPALVGATLAGYAARRPPPVQTKPTLRFAP